MTTPERLRRRQRRETALIILLGIVVSIVALIDTHQREQQAREFEACLVEQFSAVADAQAARGDIATRESKAVSDVILGVNSTLVSGDFAAIRALLSEYAAKQAQIDKDRAANPYPPFPQGECD